MTDFESVAELFTHTATVDDQAGLDLLTRNYLDLRRQVEEKETELKERKEALDRAERDCLHKMAECGVLSVRIEVEDSSPRTVSSTSRKVYAAPSGCLENNDFFRWLLRNQGSDLVKRTIHHATFSRFCRELAEQNKPLHKDVKLTEISYLAVR